MRLEWIVYFKNWDQAEDSDFAVGTLGLNVYLVTRVVKVEVCCKLVIIDLSLLLVECDDTILIIITLQESRVTNFSRCDLSIFNSCLWASNMV
jgi:hypothetical protein